MRRYVYITSCMLVMATSLMAIDQKAIDNVLEQTDARREQAFEGLLANPNYTGLNRHITFAMAAYWMNKQTSEADAGLVLSRDTGLHSADIKDFRKDAYLLARIYLLFSQQSRYFPGRMSSEAEDAILEMLWDYAHVATLEMASPSNVNWTQGTENHQSRTVVALWTTAQIFKHHPDYQNRTYVDGSLPSQMARAFDDYFKSYAVERVRQGLTVEVASPTYAQASVSPWFNLFDFTDDPELKDAANMLLTLYWADWAIEQIDGVRGGSRHRSYEGSASMRESGADRISWYIFGLGREANTHPGVMCAATTAWRPPSMIVELALDIEGRGSYAYASRRPGLMDPSPPSEPPAFRESNFHPIHPQGGSLLRYTWCTPDFVMGMSQVEALPLEDWLKFSAQNRWNGVIFGKHPTARIYGRPIPKGKSRVLNGEWGVQNKGVMILQLLSSAVNAVGEKIWFDGALKREELNGWVFAEAPGAFAALKVVEGDWSWQAVPRKGDYLVLNDKFSPVILEVVRKQDFTDMAAFQNEILSNPVKWNGIRLDYTSSHYQTTLTHFADESARPMVDGVPLDFSLKKIYDSPYIQAESPDGPVIIKYKGNKLVYNLK